MEGFLNIYNTELNLQLPPLDEIYECTTLKDLWEENVPINVTTLIKCFCLQMKIMEVVGITFYAISLEDIYQVENVFIILGKTIPIKEERFFFHGPPVLED